MDYFKHDTAIIDEGAKIGKGSRVWHWVHICSEAEIGDNCSFGQNVFVGNKVKIGNNVKIQNNVSVYDNVFIEDNVFCGPSMVFTNVYNPRSEIIRKDAYMNTYIRKGATMGANCTIICGVEVAEYTFVAAGAVVNKNTKPYSLVAGVPAKQIGWMSRFGEQIKLPLEGSGEFVCPNDGTKYILENGKMRIES